MKIAVASEQSHVTTPPVHKPVFKPRQIVPDTLIEESKVRCFMLQSTTQAEATKRDKNNRNFKLNEKLKFKKAL